MLGFRLIARPQRANHRQQEKMTTASAVFMVASSLSLLQAKADLHVSAGIAIFGGHDRTPNTHTWLYRPAFAR